MIQPWPVPLHTGTLLRRYKRFLADVRLDSGEEITAHCPNTGAMTGCAEAGMKVWCSLSDNAKRKYPYSWQLAQTREGERICIHSALANKVMAEALDLGAIAAFADAEAWQAEVPYADGSRVDFASIGGDGQPHHYMEVKSVTLHAGDGLGLFPDAVSTRARKHLQALSDMCRQGHRASLSFVVMHEGIKRVAAAADIDPAYARELAAAMDAGVECRAFAVSVAPEGLQLLTELPVLEPRVAPSQG